MKYSYHTVNDQYHTETPPGVSKNKQTNKQKQRHIFVQTQQLTCIFIGVAKKIVIGSSYVTNCSQPGVGCLQYNNYVQVRTLEIAPHSYLAYVVYFRSQARTYMCESVLAIILWSRDKCVGAFPVCLRLLQNWAIVHSLK